MKSVIGADIRPREAMQGAFLFVAPSPETTSPLRGLKALDAYRSGSGYPEGTRLVAAFHEVEDEAA